MKSTVRLSVNLNKVALIRNSRDLGIPALDALGRDALAAGAHGLTLHPRPDQRHARYDDVPVLADVVRTAGAELNVEGNPFHGPWEQTVRRVRPAQVTLVPDLPGARTSERGWDLSTGEAPGRGSIEDLAAKILDFKDLGMRVSLFVEPDPEAVAAAARLGADRVELRTQPYAEACAAGRATAALPAYERAAESAADHGLGLNAGHDLNLENLPGILRLPGLLEVSIGHALVAGALRDGFGATVRRYVELIANRADPASGGVRPHSTAT